jgi:hypothetical protein
MLDGIAHFRPLVNGDSGFIPRPYDRALELLGGPMGEEGVKLLRALGVGHVVASEDLGLPLAARFDTDRIYAVPEGETAQAPVPGEARAALWSVEGALLDLGAPRRVERVAFELSNAAWVEAPRVEASSDLATWHRVAARASLADATLALYRDPMHGKGELRLDGVDARYLRLDPRLPARPGVLWVSP